MIRVDSKKTIKNITQCFLKSNRNRNIIAVLAIILTTVMFTSLFTAIFSVVKSTQIQQIRMSGNSSHMTADDLTRDEYQKIRNHDGIKVQGMSVYLSKAENEPVGKGNTDLLYADAKGVEALNCSLIEGKYPVNENEVALGTITLDALGIPREVGSKVRLIYRLNGKKQVKEFRLSGFYEGDVLNVNQHILVSKDFYQKSGVRATKDTIRKGNPEGSYCLYIWADHIWNLSDMAESMENQYHLREQGVNLSVNSAYDYFAEDSMRVDFIFVIIVIIFGSGYLMIYNIFRISVGNDIRTYGLLCNIGMTGRQLKQLVRKQALSLALLGIPMGLILGYLAGRRMTPYLLQTSSGGGESAQTIYSFHPMIFGIAVIFSVITIYLGCLMPCKIVSKISPVEAVKMQVDRKIKGSYHKRTGKISPFSMAVGNLLRSWKKVVLVILSLALPVILLNGAYSISRSYDYNTFLDVYASFDFDVSGFSNLRSTSYNYAIKPDFVEKVSKKRDVEKLALLYNQDISHDLDDTGYRNLKAIIDRAEKEEYLSKSELAGERESLEKRQVKAHVMGINEDAYQKMQFRGNAPSYQEFSRGDYVIVSDLVQEFGNYYNPGQSVTLNLGYGKQKSYKVLEIGWMPYDLSYRFGIIETVFDCTYYLPASEYHDLGGSQDAMLAGIDIKDGREEAFQQWLDTYIEQADHHIYVESRMEMLKECQKFSEKYYVITGLLSGVLFIIGMMNFFNTVSVDIVSRKRELSLLEAVGMTERQIRKMLIGEALFYAVTAVVLADTIGMSIANPVIIDTVGAAFYFQYHPSILLSLITLPIFLFLAAFLPMYHYKKMKKVPLRERLSGE